MMGKRRSVWIAAGAGALASLLGCGGGEGGSGAPGAAQAAAAGSGQVTSSAPKAAAAPRKALPAVDPEARYEGRTLADVAAGLEDLSPRIRRKALDDIHHFGRNALPVRERLQRMLREDPEDELRLIALALLFEIEDPDAPELLRRALRDPGSVRSEAAWVDLTGLASTQLAEDELVGLVRAIASADPAHAETLLVLSAERGAFPRSAAARAALARALMKPGGSAPLVAAVMKLLPQLELSDDDKIRYVAENVERLPSSEVGLQALQQIGGQAAFAAALTVLAADPSIHFQRRLGAIAAFGPRGVPAPAILDALVPFLGQPGRTEPEVQQVFAHLEAAARVEPVAGTPRFQALLSAMAGASPSAQVRALSVLYLAGGVAAGSMGREALEPVLERLRADDDEVVLGTASQRLQEALQRAPVEALGGVPDALATLLYARPAEDPWAPAVTKAALDALRAGLAAKRFDCLATARLLARAADAHAGSPVQIELVTWMAASAALFREPPEAKRVLAEAAGRMILDPSFGAAEVQRLQATNWLELDNVSRTDLETLLTFARPVLMARDVPDALRESAYYQRSWKAMLVQLSANLRAEADVERFLAFTQEVAQDGNPDLRMEAFRVLNQRVHRLDQWRLHTGDAASFVREIGGRAVHIKPLKFINLALAPRDVETDRGDEGFLARRQNDKGVLCDVAGLERSYDVAFLDAEGTVLGLSTTDGPEVVPYGKYRNLTHPEATHALLLPKGAHALEKGQRLPLDPRFLATL